MTAEQKTRLVEIGRHSKSYVAVTRKAYEGNSRTAGVKAKCLDCCCWQRIEIANCTVSACPLHPYRPYQAGSDDEQEGQSL